MAVKGEGGNLKVQMGNLSLGRPKVLGKKNPILGQQRFYDHSKSSVTVIHIQITVSSYILTT